MRGDLPNSSDAWDGELREDHKVWLVRSDVSEDGVDCHGHSRDARQVERERLLQRLLQLQERLDQHQAHRIERQSDSDRPFAYEHRRLQTDRRPSVARGGAAICRNGLSMT
jgi:hypothetical protein